MALNSATVAVLAAIAALEGGELNVTLSQQRENFA